MRFASFIWNGRRGLAVDAGGAKFVGRYLDDPRYPQGCPGKITHI